MATMLRVTTRRVLAAALAPRAQLQRGSMANHLQVQRLQQQQRRVFSDKVRLVFVDADGEEKEVFANEGETLLDVAQDNDIELEGACGGELACSTCHLVFEKDVYDKLPEISEEEEDMLDLAWGLTDTSRLGCQIQVSRELEGSRICVPDESNNLM